MCHTHKTQNADRSALNSRLPVDLPSTSLHNRKRQSRGRRYTGVEAYTFYSHEGAGIGIRGAGQVIVVAGAPCTPAHVLYGESRCDFFFSCISIDYLELHSSRHGIRLPIIGFSCSLYGIIYYVPFKDIPLDNMYHHSSSCVVEKCFACTATCCCCCSWPLAAAAVVAGGGGGGGGGGGAAAAELLSCCCCCGGGAAAVCKK